MNKKVIFILSIILAGSLALFENDNLVKPITTVEQIEEIRQGKDDRLSVVVYWHEDSPDTPTL